jgi:hypothetical protein
MTKRKKLTALAFLAIFALGAFFRLVGLNWDQDQHLHPDERFPNHGRDGYQVA